MAKKKHSVPKSIPASNVATSSSPVKVSSFIASLMVAAGVMGKPEVAEELKVDGDFLDDLRLALPTEKAARFGPWLEHFSSFCKQLQKESSALADGAAGLQSQAISQAEAFEQERQSLLDTAENDREALKQEEEELYKQRDLLFTERQQLDELKQALMPRLESAAAKESELADRELALLTRELDARSGFASIKQQTLEVLKSEVRQLESERDHLLQDVANQKESFTRGQQEQDMALQQRERELSAKALKHEASRLRLQRQQDDLDEEKSQLQALIDEGMEGERNQHQRDLERKDKSQERLHQQMDALKGRLAGFQELMAVLGDKEPQMLLDELEELRRANSAFRASGSAADTQRLDQENAGLREQLAASESRLRDLVPELEQSKIELSRKRMGAAELETLAAEKRALEKHKQLLSVHLGDLSARIDKLTDASKAQSAFPQLSAMDSRDDCRFSPVLEPVPDDLEAFANELQQRIAQAEGLKTPLYYPIADIRTLLGGLAMSQLHVFQGISGTGKTSLAKAFAKAMGGNCTTIAVQAGWRDRDDLLGHYNAFEKRFYEKDCLQALYQAQTEAFKDRCNIILLDEMNLSRPEQYFAEFLSALEINSASERLISLSENCLTDAPRFLKEQRKILVPENLWFIGTANQDETTNELADKTYDRAHVMILPRQEETFDIQKLSPIRYSFSSLQDRFDKAISVNQDDVQELLDQLKYSDLTSVLAESFDFGWGNRFERQAKRFIPVMIECGASKQDALDHLLSTRVMRPGKVTKRFDISVEQLGRVEDALDQFWKEIQGGEAVKSKLLIVEDRRRKERGA